MPPRATTEPNRFVSPCASIIKFSVMASLGCLGRICADAVAALVGAGVSRALGRNCRGGGRSPASIVLTCRMVIENLPVVK